MDDVDDGVFLRWLDESLLPGSEPPSPPRDRVEIVPEAE